jgi:hypothetical protein
VWTGGTTGSTVDQQWLGREVWRRLVNARALEVAGAHRQWLWSTRKTR